jgi:hypothetical protein
MKKGMYKSIKILAATFCMLVLSLSAVAQAKVENSNDSLEILRWLSKSFVFNRPDTGFVALPGGNGYSNKDLGATIKFITFPGKYSKAKIEFLEEKSTETSLLIDIVYHKLNGQEAFSLIREEVSTDKAKYENFIQHNDRCRIWRRYGVRCRCLPKIKRYIA